jgi:glycerol-3-phosphate dehydrogenase
VNAHSRDALLARLSATPAWDIVIIGGGATGLGCAVDAAARGYTVLLVEARDFAAGTSSRSTKLIHGGVRYLAQGRPGLVHEALRERAHLLRNAPALVHPLRFVVPARTWLGRATLGLGLGVYDRLAGQGGLGRRVMLDPAGVCAALPGLRGDGLAGGVAYWDAQFDDAGLALALAATASRLGALVLNHCRLSAVVVEAGRVCGVRVRDALSGREWTLGARSVVNAGGVWGDAVRRLADPAAPPRLRPSQGVHLVVDGDFLPGPDALLVPRTADGRVLFVIPWLGKLLIGTTDTPRDDAPDEPEPLAGEIDFLLTTAAQWLRRPPALADVRSVFAGLRPLLAGDGATLQLSRAHRVEVSVHGLVSVMGGKWTTYRSMAEEAIDVAESVAGFARRPSPTATLALEASAALRGAAGDDEACRPLLAERPCAGLLPTVGEVWQAVRQSFALSVEDVLARRSRALFLDAALAAAAAPAVARILAQELDWSPAREAAETAAFVALAARYCARSDTVASSPPSG